MATESFFSSASLAYLASAGAGKDGKTYSIKPTDGSGDFTFSRGSNLAATRVGADGLIEKGRENLLLQSNQFNTTWVNALGAGSSITSGHSGYDGSSNAWLLSKTLDGGQIYQNQSYSSVSTYSVYAKPSASNWMLLVVSTSTTFEYAYFDISSNGSIGTNEFLIDVSITNAGNGWYRCSVVTSGNNMTRVRIYPAEANNIVTGTGSIYIQNAQLEIGLAATDYIESGATTGKAGLLEDEPRFDYSGGATCPSLLLEPSRTQLYGYSEYSAIWSQSAWITTDNYAVSPEGVKNAFRAVSSSTGGIMRIGGTGTTGQDNTLSVWAKSNTGSDQKFRFFGNGNTITSSDFTATTEWQRFDYTYACTFVTAGIKGASSELSDILFYGFQHEAGSYPTSYIPNHSGGSVTRGGDYSESSTSLSIGDSEFSAYYEMDAEVIPREGSTTFFRIEFNGGSDFIGLKGSSNSINNMYTLQTFGSYLETLGNITEAGVVKFLINYSSGTGDLFVNGTKYAGVITGPTTGNTIDNVELRGGGYSHDSKQILLFPEVLSEADCITLTT